METNFVFIALSGIDVGFGHLNRCITLGEYARRNRLNSYFFVVGEGAEILKKKSFDAVNVSTVRDVLGPFSKIIKTQTIVILDIFHPEIIKNHANLLYLIRGIKKLGHVVVIIDNLGQFSFRRISPPIAADMIVVPYAGPADELKTSTTLIGPEYAILSEPYANIKKRKFNRNPTNILITMGGSDPMHLTPKILQALETLTKKFFVKVVVGPHFSEGQIYKIEQSKECSKHEVELVLNESCLVDKMQWADLVVASSGIVKYELAATGTPSILISIDEEHNVVNKSFAKLSGQVDLGVTKRSSDIGNAIADLLNDDERREKMILLGQKLVDGKGVEKIFCKLRAFLH